MSIKTHNNNQSQVYFLNKYKKPVFSGKRKTEYLLKQENIPLEETASVMLDMLGLRNIPNFVHSYSVAFYSEAFAKELGLNKRRQEVIKTAGLFHDIGKVSLSDNFFNKTTDTGKNDSYLKHPELGESLLKKIDVLEKNKIPEIVGQHHEKYDGSGFPGKLKGDEIRLEAQIIHLADVFDSITKPKYQTVPKSTAADAVDMMRKESGKKFNPELLGKFIDFVTKDNFAVVDEVQAKVKAEAVKFSASLGVNLPAISQVDKRWLISDEKYISSLAKNVECRPENLKAVMGPRELKRRIEKTPPESFNPDNAESGLFNINLHLHTTASDGQFTPQTLFEEVYKQVKNIRKNGKKDDFVVAISDHDNMEGVKAALSYIAEQTEKNPERFNGIRFVPAIEINAKYENPKILKNPICPEILVYSVNPYEGGLKDLMENTAKKQNELINSVITEAEQKHTIDISDFEEFKQHSIALRIPSSSGINLGLSKYFRKKGLQEIDIEELLKDKFIDKYITVHTPSVTQILKSSKGTIAGIAHPVRIDYNGALKKGLTPTQALRETFRDFKERGGFAVEANYQLDEKAKKYVKLSPGETLKEREMIITQLAEETGLLKAGGVDNHGASLLKR